MNNVKDQGVLITGLDKDRYMKFTLNSLCDLQDEYGDIMEVFQSGLKKSDFKLIRKLLFVSLNDHDESLTEQKVGKLITMQNLEDIVSKLHEALEGSVPEEEVTEGKSKPRKAK